MKQITALIILDGWGYSPLEKYNGIAQANKPTFDWLWHNYPHALLQASGTAVGLPQGYAGNSEVGHITIGSGRIIKQPLTCINQAIDDGSFYTNPLLVDPLRTLATSGKTLHLIGLLSDAGVHSHIQHLTALIEAAHKYGVKEIIIHAILDGRDVAPQSALHYLEQVSTFIKAIPQAKIGSIAGRYYALDRNNNWDRTQKMREMLINPRPIHQSPSMIIENYYHQGITDEFIPPTAIADFSLENGDGVIFWHFRPDRIRQLISCILGQNCGPFKNKPVDLAFCLTLVPVSNQLSLQSLYHFDPLQGTLKEIISKHRKTIFSIAETEKYAHITYFFDGGNEKEFPGETRVLIPSLRTQTYSEHPCMSAAEITQAVITSLQTNPCDFYLINYANADMVGHSGNMPATSKAIECLDSQLKILYETLVIKYGGTLYITADHGKAECMFNEKTGQPHTAHTCNPVPFIAVNQKWLGDNTILPLTQLCEIMGYILKNRV